jgi:two-component system, NarL family, response regulator NreC
VQKTTIVLAEAQYLVRRGVRCLVEKSADMKVVGEAGDGVEAVRVVRRLKPRVLIAEVAMPGLNGLEATRQVQRLSPTTAVIVLSMYSHEYYVVHALKNGASGYVVKYAKPGELVRAIRHVAAGHCYLSEPLSERPLQTWLEQARRVPRDSYETLTAREREVLHLVAEGHSSARVAKRLSISRRTAESHRASIMRKIDCRNQADLTRYALARGILRPLEPLPPW